MKNISMSMHASTSNKSAVEAYMKRLISGKKYLGYLFCTMSYEPTVSHIHYIVNTYNKYKDVTDVDVNADFFKRYKNKRLVRKANTSFCDCMIRMQSFKSNHPHAYSIIMGGPKGIESISADEFNRLNAVMKQSMAFVSLYSNYQTENEMTKEEYNEFLELYNLFRSILSKSSNITIFEKAKQFDTCIKLEEFFSMIAKQFPQIYLLYNGNYKLGTDK